MASSPTCYRDSTYLFKGGVFFFSEIFVSFLSGVVPTALIPEFSKFSVHVYIYIYDIMWANRLTYKFYWRTESCFNFHFRRRKSYMRAWRTPDMTGNIRKQSYSLLFLSIVLHHVVLQQISHHTERLMEIIVKSTWRTSYIYEVIQ